MATREHEIRELSLFQLWNQAFAFIMREFARPIIKNRFHGLGRGGVKESDHCRVLPVVSCYCSVFLGHHPNADAYWSGRIRQIHQLTCPPFTSLEAAQSSRIMSVFVPSKNNLTIFSHISTSCCSHVITNILGSFSPIRKKVLLCANVGQMRTM